MSWPFSVRPLTPYLGAEISGIDLAQEISRDSSARCTGLSALPGLALSAAGPSPARAGSVRPALRRAADPRHEPVSRRRISRALPPVEPRRARQAERAPSGQGTLAWHTDGSWQRVTGQATIIYGEVMPESGGETHFCDMYGAYERLDAAWKARIANLRAVHNLDFSRSRRHGEDPLTEAQRRAAAGRPPGRAHPSRDRTQVPATSAITPNTSSACPTTRGAP